MEINITKEDSVNIANMKLRTIEYAQYSDYELNIELKKHGISYPGYELQGKQFVKKG